MPAVTFAFGVGVTTSQTVNFVVAGGDASGIVTENQGHRPACYKLPSSWPGDQLIFQNLGGVPDSETVIDGNGFATVNIMS